MKIQRAAEVEAYRMQVAAEAEEMRVKGFTYQQETARQVGMTGPDPTVWSWDCACGQTGLTGKFCPKCGKKRGE